MHRASVTIARFVRPRRVSRRDALPGLYERDLRKPNAADGPMKTNRLEAFSDGVLAIVITIMVLELEVPRGSSPAAFQPLWGAFLSYVLSFVFVATYWNNHNHLLYTVHAVTGGMLWANMHLLFWISVVPFVTRWMGESHFARAPTAAYGCVLFMAAIAYWILQRAIIRSQGRDSLLRQAIGDDWKGGLSRLLLLTGIVVAAFTPYIAGVIYALTVALWLVPDKRIERVLMEPQGSSTRLGTRVTS